MWQFIFEVSKLFRKQKINTDSFTCKLVYRFLSTFLVISGITSFANNYFGGHMQCMTSSASDDRILNAACWSQGTWLYGSDEEFDRFRRLHSAISPGIHGDHSPTAEIYPGLRSKTDPEPQQIYHGVYAYLPFVFILLSLSCHVGRYGWSRLQGLTIQQLIRDIRNPSTDEATLDQTVSQSANRFVSDIRQHKSLANMYLICLFINMIFLLCQFAVVLMLSHGDWKFGYTAVLWVAEPYENWPHSLARAFPQITKCTIRSFGIGGNVIYHDSLCFLTMNKTNLICFSIHWWCLAFLLPLTLAELCSCLLKRYVRWFRCLSLRLDLNVHPRSDVGEFLQQLNYGSSLVVSILCKNIPTDLVCRILLEVKSDFETNGDQIQRLLRGFQ